jgi:hypothetical protein
VNLEFSFSASGLKPLCIVPDGQKLDVPHRVVSPTLPVARPITLGGAVLTVALLFGAVALFFALIGGGSSEKNNSTSSSPAQSKSCDEGAAQKTIDMVTLGNPALFLRVKDGTHVRYTFTTVGWSVASPQVSTKFTQLALSLSESENCVASSNLLHLEFYRGDGQHVASVSPWTGVSVDGE